MYILLIHLLLNKNFRLVNLKDFLHIKQSIYSIHLVLMFHIYHLINKIDDLLLLAMDKGQYLQINIKLNILMHIVFLQQ